MQRLFSNFANGWPGAGILLQRGLAGSVLFYCGLVQVFGGIRGVPLVLEAVGIVAGLLLLVGLWTPATGMAAFTVELWLFILGTGEPTAGLVSGILGMTIAMIGPGAWSIDARIFGRKHFEAPSIPQK